MKGIIILTRKGGYIIKIKSYKFEEIINNKNLLFDIKHDNIFRNVFLNVCSFDYVCKLFSYLLCYDYQELKENLKIVNNEHTSDSAYKYINRSDIIYEFKDIYIIFEMNMSDKEFHINKNYQYLFKQHSSRLNNSNKYKKKTILINIDNYDVGEENDLIYDSKIYISKYYKNIYNYIDILHINLDSLRNKIYNKGELNSIDRLLLIFVEQDKRNLIGLVEREVINIMDYMARLDFKEGDPVTYNYLEAEKVRKEMWEEKVETWNKKMKQDKKILSKTNKILNKTNRNLKKKNSLAKALKAEGYPTNKILKITKLSKNIIMML